VLIFNYFANFEIKRQMAKDNYEKTFSLK